MSFFAEIPNFDYSSEMSDDAVTLGIQQARLPFIENQGQIPTESIKYYAKTFAGTIYVTDSDLTYYSIKKQNDSAKALVIKEKFLGDSLQPVGVDKSHAVVSYFKGPQENWNAGIPTFDGVLLGTIWPNIDVNLKAYGNNVEKIFTVHPSGKPADIRMTFEGINGLSLSENNELVVDTDLGDVILSKPIAYQHIDGKRHGISASYDIIDSHTYTFSVLSYDPRSDLVIDPLIASTFIGGGSDDIGWDLAFDGTGNVYVVGATFDDAVDFPTTGGAYDTTHNGFSDVFVSKFNGVLTTLSASTFIGGDGDDQGYAIALDNATNVYITGLTVDGTLDFPTTGGAYDTTHNGFSDVFVAKLNSALTTLSASTFIGGSDDSTGEDIALDSSGNVYVVGYASNGTTVFPTTGGAYDTTYNGGAHDVFVSKFNGVLTTLSASTFIGGNNTDIAFAIALDSAANVYITGDTTNGTLNFPTTGGAYDTTHNGLDDVFVSKFNSALTTLSASTLIGGSNNDNSGYSIALDSSGNVYITGMTTNGTIAFPTTSGAYDTTYNGGAHDVFVSKFNSALTTLSASTLIGGNNADLGFAIALDSAANVYITGNTTDGTVDFPTTGGAYDTTHNGLSDIFVSKFNSALTTLSASTFIGGSNPDAGYLILLDSSGNVYITGETSSANYPTTSGAYDTTHNGNYDAVVSIFDCNLSATGSTCGSLESGGSISIPVSAGGTAEVNLPSGNDLAVTLPAGTSGTVTVTDTDSGTSDASIGFFGDITDIEVSGSGCTSGCTISFTFTGDDAEDEGLSPSEAIVYHDSNENGSFESDEGLATTVTGDDPYTATATASFTSKFAVGGVRALAIAAVASQVLGSAGQLGGCDPDGFGSGISLRVYSIAYDKCETNKIDIVAYSTCGPISAEIASQYGTRIAAISDHQPFFKDVEKRVIYSTGLDPELESVNVIVKDKRDSFTEKIFLNQCTASKSYTYTTGYTAEQQEPSFGNETLSDITMPIGLAQSELGIPSWIKNNAKWWSSGQIADSEFSQGIEYLIKQDIIDVPESAKTETAQEPKQIPAWIKTNSQWWSEGMISDSEFTKGLEYLIKIGVIRV